MIGTRNVTHKVRTSARHRRVRPASLPACNVACCNFRQLRRLGRSVYQLRRRDGAVCTLCCLSGLLPLKSSSPVTHFDHVIYRASKSSLFNCITRNGRPTATAPQSPCPPSSQSLPWPSSFQATLKCNAFSRKGRIGTEG